MYNVGVMYNDGDGVERCVAKALTWFGEAAKRGDAEAAAWCARLRAPSSG
jgi:TPR repeat protein